jgi:hypothetical protein
MSSNKVDRQIDSYIDNIIKLNYNGFASNNNNPFLVSPYAPTANAGIINQINDINITISSLNENISSLFDLSTMTLRISTITDTLDSNTLTLSTINLLIEATNVNIDADNTNITGITNISNLNASNINFSTLTGTILNFSTLTGSTINARSTITSNLNFSTLTGSSIITRTMNYTSITGVAVRCNEFDGQFMRVSDSIFTPTITSGTTSTTNITFDTTEGSLINASTISTGYISFDTIIGSTISTNIITTNDFIFSSLYMTPSTISSFDPPANIFYSSILICLDGSYWKIPIFPV